MAVFPSRVERIKFSEAALTRLKKFLNQELDTAIREHEKLELTWREAEKYYDAIPDVEKKNFPFKDASNLVAPIVAIHTEAIFARIINTIFSVDPLWVARAMNKDFVDIAVPTQQYLHWLQKYRIKLYERIAPGLKQVVKIGTGTLVLGWERQTKKILHYDKAGKVVGPSEVSMYTGPMVNFIRAQDLITPSDAGTDIQEARWAAHRRYPTWWELKARAARKEYYNVDDIKSFMEKQPEKIEEFRKKQFGVDLGSTMPELGTYETFVWWGDYDANGDGIAEQCRFVYHRKSETVLDATYNYLLDGRRPFIPLRYMFREGAYHGEGIAWQVGNLQRAYSTQINQAIDNSSVANTKMFKGKKGAVKEEEEIWPGKLWMLGRLDDLASMDMGDINPSVLAALGYIKDLAQLRSGVSDYNLGQESAIVGHRATATSTLALIQEGNKRFDLTIRDIRHSFSELAMQVLLLEQQYGSDTIDFFQPGGSKMEQYTVPKQYARLGLGLDVSASSASINREVEKQNNLALFNLVLSYYERLTEVSGILAKPEIPSGIKDFVVKLVEKSGKLLERVLQSYAVPDPETFAVNVEDLRAAAEQGSALGGGEDGGPPVEGGPGGVPAGGRAGGMGGPPAGPVGGPPQGAPPG
jgi:hypothetical protein